MENLNDTPEQTIPEYKICIKKIDLVIDTVEGKHDSMTGEDNERYDYVPETFSKIDTLFTPKLEKKSELIMHSTYELALNKNFHDL
jgi:hypothetical protein